MATDNESLAEERNEPATPFRREEFRRAGQVALSREVLSVVLLGAAGLTLAAVGSSLLTDFSALCRRFFTFSAEELNKGGALSLLGEAGKAWAWMAGPLLGVAVAVGFVACAAQVGLYVTWEPLSPNWDRVNPFQGMRRLLSTRSFVEAAKALVKMAAAIFVLALYLKSQATSPSGLMGQGAEGAFAMLLKSVGQLFFWVVAVLAVLAAADYGFQRLQLEKQMRMTRREAKDEFKLREGDPLIKQRIRSIQRRMASRRMMEEVPEADVVVTNPTHFAVALKYDKVTMLAPKVVAKGAGVVAQKIKELARKSGVPTVENKPLARQLFRDLDVGETIPRELYKAVAEVLAYVYRLKAAATRPLV